MSREKNSLLGYDPFEVEPDVELDPDKIEFLFGIDMHDGLWLDGMVSYYGKPMYFTLYDIVDLKPEKIPEDKRHWNVRWVRVATAVYDLPAEKREALMAFGKWIKEQPECWGEPEEGTPEHELFTRLSRAAEVTPEELDGYVRVGVYWRR